ncbi:MAG: type II toxin-antitoxin system HicB family antitoxin [Gammaproteobacteria bacterium]
MNYVFHVLIEKTSGSWKARCPALEYHGAVSGGETKEEALTHIQSVLLLILFDMEQKGMEIPKDEIRPNGIPIAVDTAAE